MKTQPDHGLATLNGVSPSCVGAPPGVWPTFTDFLVERFPAISRQVWLARMALRLVVDEFGVAVTPERPYRGHLRLYYYRDLPTEPRLPFEAAVLYQDAHLVVADKPHFLPVTPSGPYLQETLLVRLKNQLGLNDLTPLHRIDRETAGIVVFSVRPHERDAYQSLFRTHDITKHYEAIAPWREELGLAFPQTRRSRIVQGEPFFRQREALEAGLHNSETHLQVLEVSGSLARYGLQPVTGKKHQLRVHLFALGLAIVNDRIYPPVVPTPEDDHAKPLQLLAKSIAFKDPVTGQNRAFNSRRQLHLPRASDLAGSGPAQGTPGAEASA